MRLRFFLSFLPPFFVSFPVFLTRQNISRPAADCYWSFCGIFFPFFRSRAFLVTPSRCRFFFTVPSARLSFFWPCSTSAPPLPALSPFPVSRAPVLATWFVFFSEIFVFLLPFFLPFFSPPPVFFYVWGGLFWIFFFLHPAPPLVMAFVPTLFFSLARSPAGFSPRFRLLRSLFVPPSRRTRCSTKHCPSFFSFFFGRVPPQSLRLCCNNRFLLAVRWSCTPPQPNPVYFLVGLGAAAISM